MLPSETGWSHEIVIEYTYDPLKRLRSAQYSDERQFNYILDSVGNILTQQIDLGAGEAITTTYRYDAANRLIDKNGQALTRDNNGNFLSDGVDNYTYDHANRMTSANVSGAGYTFAYNGLGARLRQTVDEVPTEYTLDMAGGLTQVLADVTHTYLYGNGRIAQYAGTTPEYYLGDALGSVRQMVDASGNVVIAKEYDPYGEVMMAS